MEPAKKIVDQLTAAGFDQARVTHSEQTQHELSIDTNEVSLMRSTTEEQIKLFAIKDHRKVSGSLSSLEPEGVKDLIAKLLEDSASTPPDPAFAVSEDQVGSFTQGPQDVDRDSLALGAKNFLEYRAQSFPSFQIREASLAHVHSKTKIVSSLGSELLFNEGQYRVSVLGLGKDEKGSSSFNHAAGLSERMPEKIHEIFDIKQMMEDTVLGTDPKSLGGKFTGDVILMPGASGMLLGWLFSQLRDSALLKDTSVFRHSVDKQIASELLTIRQSIEGFCAAPFNQEGFLVKDLDVLTSGVLQHLLPSYYISRKLDLPHYPIGGRLVVAPGKTSQSDMISGLSQGAVVSSISLGYPSAEGDFSGVIKNSFLVENGQKTRALTETMITGNIRKMLMDIVAVSQETTDFGWYEMPWIQIKGLKFS